MKKVRIGVVGLGAGGGHARQIMEGKIARAELTAVCDLSPERMAPFEKAAKPFAGMEELFSSGLIDAVVIATPHYSHTPLGIAALRKGFHVLVEKPISVHKADCLRLIAAHKNKKQVFAAMFNMRTVPCFAKVRGMVRGGDLGELRRVNWILTDWFRTDAYYASGGWRATWKGEGGGVLLNQCPHQLDLLQWIAGMPARLRAFCYFGKYHPIEVEDDVNAFMEYKNGATGVFIATTGEAPGTNRLEITGDRGKLVVESGKILFTRNTLPMNEFCKTSKTSMGKPEVTHLEVPIPPAAMGQHAAILQNFTDAILDGTPLIAPAEEGIHSVELANAMICSSVEDKWVELPLDAKHFERVLGRLIREAESKKKKSGRRR